MELGISGRKVDGMCCELGLGFCLRRGTVNEDDNLVINGRGADEWTAAARAFLFLALGM